MARIGSLRYEVDDSIARIILARPDKRNALSRQMFQELGDLAEAAGSDSAVRGVLVLGEGPSFCAGIDLELLSDLAAEGATDRDSFRSFVRMAQRPYLALAEMPKPTVAAVQGHALGAGFQLALACDLRVAADDIQFAMLEARYGLIPDLGGMYHLTRLVGPARAKELVWTTRSVGAEEAERTGLVNRVVRPDDLTEEAESLLRACLAFPPAPTASTKELIGRAFDRILEDELAKEAEAQDRGVSGSSPSTGV